MNFLNINVLILFIRVPQSSAAIPLSIFDNQASALTSHAKNTGLPPVLNFNSITFARDNNNEIVSSSSSPCELSTSPCFVTSEHPTDIGPEFSFIRSTKGKDLVLSGGYIYNQNNASNNTVYYRCNDYGCNARGKLLGGTFSESGKHSHNQAEGKVDALYTKNLLKDEMRRNPSHRKSRVYEVVMKRVIADHASPGQPGRLPSYRNASRMLKRLIPDLRPPSINSREDPDLDN